MLCGHMLLTTKIRVKNRNHLYLRFKHVGFRKGEMEGEKESEIERQRAW